jgi:probable rRNA maturation factor
MDVTLQIDPPFAGRVDPDRINQAVQLTLQQIDDQTSSTVTVVITDSETIRQFNRRYRGVDTPTDVLSFENKPDPDFPTFDRDHLGDIVIAYPIATAQAAAAGHETQAEVILLAIHGTLHLAGFDHDTPVHKEQMWTIQQQVLAELGLPGLTPTEN